MIHSVKDNILAKVIVDTKSYTQGSTDPSPAKIDRQTCLQGMLVIDVRDVSSTAIVVKAYEATSAADGSPTAIAGKTLSITEAGRYYIELSKNDFTKPFITAVVSQSTGKADTIGIEFIGVNPINLPVTN